VIVVLRLAHSFRARPLRIYRQPVFKLESKPSKEQANASPTSESTAAGWRAALFKSKVQTRAGPASEARRNRAKLAMKIT
jgi:hypothetical protein